MIINESKVEVKRNGEGKLSCQSKHKVHILTLLVINNLAAVPVATTTETTTSSSPAQLLTLKGHQ